jgi:predicted MFS family arabinose efflux permease
MRITLNVPESLRPARLPAAFQRLAWSNLVAQSAEQIGLAAAPLVAVFALGATARETGLLQTAQTLPFLLLSIPLGVLADRNSRRALMTVAEAVRVLAMTAVLLLLFTHALSLPLLAVLGFLGATGTVAYSVAAPALVPSLVERAALAAANGRIELARSVAYSAGPALGGLLVGWIGAGWAYGCAAVLSACAVALLAGLREPARGPRVARHFAAELRDGARFVLRDALLRPMFATAVFFNIGFFILQAVYVPYAAHRLGLGASAIGVTLGAYGVGMVCGALAAPSIARRLAFGRVLTIGPLCGFFASLTMVATLVVPSFWLAALSFFMLGAGPILWTVGSTTLRQAITPAGMMGRVSALNSTATYGARPLGALLGVVISARMGLDACLLAAVACFAVQVLIIAMSPAARLDAIPDPAAARSGRRDRAVTPAATSTAC